MGSNRYHMSGSNIELYKILNGFAWVESKQSGLNLGAGTGGSKRKVRAKSELKE